MNGELRLKDVAKIIEGYENQIKTEAIYTKQILAHRN